MGGVTLFDAYAGRASITLLLVHLIEAISTRQLVVSHAAFSPLSGLLSPLLYFFLFVSTITGQAVSPHDGRLDHVTGDQPRDGRSVHVTGGQSIRWAVSPYGGQSAHTPGGQPIHRAVSPCDGQ